MAEDRNVTGKITTPVSLMLNTFNLPWGKWQTNPSTQVAAGSQGVTVFYAMGRKGSATGTEGTVTYAAPDGTLFALYFDDPYSSGNNATLTARNGQASSYRCQVDFPRSGNSWVATYTIQKI